jgi:hypothetical protein
MGHGLRHFQKEEARRRIPIVLTALVYYSDIAVLGGLFVRYHSI